MSSILISCRSLLAMTLLLGVLYPLSITVLGKLVFPIKSQGSLFYTKEHIVGSELIAQKFSSKGYFWSRPSAVDYASHSAGASQKSATSSELKKIYQERVRLYGAEVPNDMLWASGSGLDPHISLESAKFQASRVAEARNMTIKELDDLIEGLAEDRFLGFMGQPRVNVLKLNRIIDNKR